MQSKRFVLLMAAAEAKRERLLQRHPGDRADVALPPPSPGPAPSPLILAWNPLPSLLKRERNVFSAIMNVLQINHPGEAVSPPWDGDRALPRGWCVLCPGYIQEKVDVGFGGSRGCFGVFFSAKGANDLQPLQCQAGTQTVPAILSRDLLCHGCAQDKSGGGKISAQHPEILQEILNKTLLAQPGPRTVTDRMGTVN